MPDFGAFNISASSLFASVFWGAIGGGMALFGKKQRSWIPMGCGLAITAVSYFVNSAVLMSLTCLAILGAMYWMKKQDWE